MYWSKKFLDNFFFFFGWVHCDVIDEFVKETLRCALLLSYYVYLYDFKICYDAKFGRKKPTESSQNGQSTEKPVSNGSSSNGYGQREISIYEQYQNQVLCLLYLFMMVRLVYYFRSSFFVLYFCCRPGTQLTWMEISPMKVMGYCKNPWFNILILYDSMTLLTNLQKFFFTNFMLILECQPVVSDAISFILFVV